MDNRKEKIITTIKDLCENDPIHKLFTKKRVKLHIAEGGECAWVQCGKMTYFFNKIDGSIVHNEYKAKDGQKKKRTTIPYIGREYNV